MGFGLIQQGLPYVLTGEEFDPGKANYLRLGMTLQTVPTRDMDSKVMHTWALEPFLC